MAQVGTAILTGITLFNQLQTQRDGNLASIYNAQLSASLTDKNFQLGTANAVHGVLTPDGLSVKGASPESSLGPLSQYTALGRLSRVRELLCPHRPTSFFTHSKYAVIMPEGFTDFQPARKLKGFPPVAPPNLAREVPIKGARLAADVIRRLKTQTGCPKMRTPSAAGLPPCECIDELLHVVTRYIAQKEIVAGTTTARKHHSSGVRDSSGVGRKMMLPTS